MEPIRDYTMYAAFSGCLSSVGSDGPKNRAIIGAVDRAGSGAALLVWSSGSVPQHT